MRTKAEALHRAKLELCTLADDSRGTHSRPIHQRAAGSSDEAASGGASDGTSRKAEGWYDNANLIE